MGASSSNRATYSISEYANTNIQKHTAEMTSGGTTNKNDDDDDGEEDDENIWTTTKEKEKKKRFSFAIAC